MDSSIKTDDHYDYDYEKIESTDQMMMEFGQAYNRATGLMPYVPKSSNSTCFIDHI